MMREIYVFLITNIFPPKQNTEPESLEDRRQKGRSGRHNEGHSSDSANRRSIPNGTAKICVLCRQVRRNSFQGESTVPEL